MSPTKDFKILIQHASLFVRKVKVAPPVLIAHEVALTKGVIKMPIRRTEVKSFALSTGIQSVTIPNSFIGQLPTRIIMAMVSNTAFNGDFGKNPFNFKHYDISYICAIEGRYHKDQDINVSFSEYKDGYTLFAIDLTPDLSADGMHESISRNGNLTIDIKFSKALPETVNLLVYSEYRNTIEIDKNRTIFTDY
ncbi:uncharacterized protein F54H12.2 [Trichonephila clavipes]|nr:uncharacterized protein F54H12.2 [Trichonephila clavipes]